MATALGALGDDGINAEGRKMSGQHGGCHDRNYSDAGRFPCGHVLAGIAGPRGHDFDTLIDDDLGKFVRLRVHQHNVDAKRLIGQAAALADVLPQCFGVHAACTDQAQRTGVGAGRCKLTGRNVGHAALYDWVFCAQNFIQQFHFLYLYK